MINRYYDMTDSELLELSDEGIAHLISVEVAFEGIIPVSKPTLEEPVEPQIEKTVTMFQIGFSGPIFASSADVEQYLKLNRFEQTNTDEAGYAYKYFAEVRNEDFREVDGYSKDDLLEFGPKLKEYTCLKKEYDSAWANYYKYLRESSKCSDTVWGAVHNARKRKKELEEMREQAANYIQLAEGNLDIAYTFFSKAFGDRGASDINETVISEFFPDAPADTGS